MIVLNYEAAARFMRDHAASRKPLNHWIAAAEELSWTSFEEIRQTYSTADRVGGCIVFDIGGNKFRLITIVDYDVQVITVKQVLTHAEYNRNKWKKDC